MKQNLVRMCETTSLPKRRKQIQTVAFRKCFLFSNYVFLDPEVMISCHNFAAVMLIVVLIYTGKAVLYSHKGKTAARNITTPKLYRFILLASLILIVFNKLCLQFKFKHDAPGKRLNSAKHS